jgi:hypothetical protein
MASITMQEFEEFPTLPAGSIIHTTVKAVEVKTVPGRNGKDDWQKLEFTFNIDAIQSIDGGGQASEYESLIGSKIWGSTSFKLTSSPENKLRQWTEAILGMEIAPGFELDTDLLVGRKVRVITSTYDKKTMNPRTGQPFKQHQADALLPFGGETAFAGATTGAGWATGPATDEAPF